MTPFTDRQLVQQLETVLGVARSEGEVRVRDADGREYAIRPVTPERSPLDIPGIDLKLSAEEIVSFVREWRDR